METDASRENEQTSTEGAQLLGRSSATEREAITSDKFAFWLSDDVIVNPFDIVSVGQVSQEERGQSRTFGLVTSLEHRTDAPSHLANYISSNFGDLEEVPNSNRQGTTVALANVLSNTDDIYMPVTSEQIVRFAETQEIHQALGTDLLIQERPSDAVPAGLIKMSNGASAVAFLDKRYLLGPESAHVNISGISGLATKTSYAMFLIQSILQTSTDEDDIAVVILNVKQADLLHIGKAVPDLPAAEKETWESLGLEPQPFKNVRYFLPRGESGGVNSYLPTPDIYTTYAYDLVGTADKLELLFSALPDSSGTIEGIYGEIKEIILNNENDAAQMMSWTALQQYLFAKMSSNQRWRGLFASSSIGMFRRHLRRIVTTGSTGLFVDSRASRERLLSHELSDLNGGETYVVDIAKLSDEEQSLVFGDILRTIYEVKSGAPANRRSTRPVPGKVIVFVDELNKYAPGGSRESPITQQVLEVAERGRSLGVILISAQQFMSAVHTRVTGNSATKIIGRTGSAEINSPDYRFLDPDIRSTVTRLAKGELLLSHAVYRQPVRVVFPRPAYRQDQGR